MITLLAENSEKILKDLVKARHLVNSPKSLFFSKNMKKTRFDVTWKSSPAKWQQHASVQDFME
jgi:hypothetical protein